MLDIEKLQLPSIDRSWKTPLVNATTTEVDVQKLKLQSLEAHSPGYSGGVALSTEVQLK